VLKAIAGPQKSSGSFRPQGADLRFMTLFPDGSTREFSPRSDGRYARSRGDSTFERAVISLPAEADR